MKSIARTHIWWLGVDREIERITHNCRSCSTSRNKPPQTTLHQWKWPEKPWQRLHIDYAGPFLGKYFFIVVDAHTKWPEVIPMITINTEKIIEELRKLFATHGLPEQIVPTMALSSLRQSSANF